MPFLDQTPMKCVQSVQEQQAVNAHDFYNSLQWHRLRQHKLSVNPICERCEREPATDVHHVVPFMKTDNPYFYFSDFLNLKSLCEKCHHIVHNEMRNS